MILFHPQLGNTIYFQIILVNGRTVKSNTFTYIFVGKAHYMTQEEFAVIASKYSAVHEHVAVANSEYSKLKRDYVEANSQYKEGGRYHLDDLGLRNDLQMHKKSNRIFLIKSLDVELRPDKLPVILAFGDMLCKQKPIGTFKVIVHGAISCVTFKRTA